MGCGESKHDVASGNTIRNSKKLGSKKGYETLPSEKPAADLNAVAGNGNENPKADSAAGKLEVKENEKPKTNSVVEEKVKEKASEIVEAAKEGEKLKPPVKETDENEKLKVAEGVGKADEKSEEVKEEKKEDEKLKLKGEISEEKEKEKREETTIEEIITEGISGKSEYYSPAAKDGVVVESPQLKDVVVEENKTETQKEEAGEVKEENIVKEEKISTTIAEVKVSPSNEEVKVPSATKEETATESAAKDSETN